MLWMVTHINPMVAYQGPVLHWLQQACQLFGEYGMINNATNAGLETWMVRSAFYME